MLLALRNSAKYIDLGQVVDIPGPKLMDSAKPIHIYPAFAFEGYPNRDSTHYRELYHIPEAQTVLRGTLRYQVSILSINVEGISKVCQGFGQVGILV